MMPLWINMNSRARVRARVFASCTKTINHRPGKDMITPIAATRMSPAQRLNERPQRELSYSRNY